MAAVSEVATVVERTTQLSPRDLDDLCDAADTAILDGGGFGWLKPPPRHVMEAYWRGVLLVPERVLFIARLDGAVAGSTQMVRPPRNNEAQAFGCTMTTTFVAPWARGHGLARGLVEAVEHAAREAGFAILNLDVRDTQGAAIELYERLGFRRWGVHPAYAMAGGKRIAGYYYYKELV
ncbi:MAG: GNAT family N-acetyltransferase [Proteobacteria bacterium]|nr:GNAT family N-acetyltransferase [Pseudomonadota bacterium]